MKKYKDLKSEQSVIVYQYGKVGSTSLCRSLESGINVHDLYGNVMCPPGFKLRNGLLFKVFFRLDRFLRRFFIRMRKEVKIIVPLREPADRNVSMFFQDLPFWYVDYFSKNKVYAKGEGIAILQDVFMRAFPHDSCDAWFDKEFARFTGIKLEDVAFDVDKKTGYAKKGRYKCMFIHHDMISRPEGVAEIGRFVGKDLHIQDSNRGRHKWYSQAYRDFVSADDFMSEYREKMSGSKVRAKFYS